MNFFKQLSENEQPGASSVLNRKVDESTLFSGKKKNIILQSSKVDQD